MSEPEKFSHITWDDHGLPRSVIYDDKYFCTENGLLESEYVFCGGNRLRERFTRLSDSDVFTIGETGFGTGLNFLTAWKLWRESAPVSACLRFFSFDRYPLSQAELARSLGSWPSLSGEAAELVAQYRPEEGTVQTLSFDDGRVVLTLCFDDVLNALDRFRDERCTVNAWFLDGFAPSKNPEMWSDDVFRRMAVLSAEGTTVSTFTVAGFVRRGLNACGFRTTKPAGFGRKRQMLEGVFVSGTE